MRYSTVSTLCLAAVAAARPFTEGELSPVDRMIKRQGGCKEATLIFCRGTFEPGGPLGMLVGSPFMTVVKAAVGSSKIEVKGVTYDAGVVGYLIGGDPAGATTMAKMVTEAVQKCPNTKIILGGYSQGAQVVHLAAAKLSDSEKERVAAIVMFGDPYKGKAFPGIGKDKVHTICADSDMICWGLPLPIGPHLTYGSDKANLQIGATFIKDRVAAHSGGDKEAPKGKSGKGKSSEPKESKPKESKPKESKPKESKPKESKPKESKPKESKPKDSAPKENKPKESKPKESKPVEAKPAEAKPAEAKPEASTPKESKPAEPKEAEKTMEGMAHEHAGERMTLLNEEVTVQGTETQDGRVLPLGSEGNPALVGVVDSLFRAAYADIGVTPAVPQ